jgi:hypothetical protein
MGMNNTQCLSVWKYHNEAGYGGTHTHKPRTWEDEAGRL